MFDITAVSSDSYDPTFQALPPEHQQAREIRAIEEDPRLRDMLGSGEHIVEIRKNGSGYTVVTNQQEIQVGVHYLSDHRPGWCGPAQFELIF